MAKRYKGYKSLNKMIEELENTIISYNPYTNEDIKPTIVTKKAPAQAFQDIININTGRFYSYEEARNLSLNTTGEVITYQDYLERIHEFQHTEYFKQLTIQGEMEYHIKRAEAIFGDVLAEDILSKLSNSEYRVVIDTIGRLSNSYKETSSKYDSNKFYDMFNMYMELVGEGVNPLNALEQITSMNWN